MKKQLRDSSISVKLNLLGTLTAGIALFLACVMFVMNDASTTKAAMVEHVVTLAETEGLPAHADSVRRRLSALDAEGGP